MTAQRLVSQIPRSAILGPLRINRLLHITQKLEKNPYYFYDLATKQPHGVPGHSFDPGQRDDLHLSPEERALRVFGSLGVREVSKKAAELKQRTIAGVKVPGKPEEPTNCCMSGCVNCVWELYKDELEEWRHIRSRAKQALMQPERMSEVWPADFGPEPVARKEGKAGVEIEEEDEWDDVDVGIRVFVETEKRLHQKQKAAAAAAAANKSPSP